MSQVDFLGKAIEIVKKATEEDQNENFEEAYRLYQNALEYFLTAMKCTWFNPDEKNEKLKDSIRKKFTEYLDRAEKLKEFLANKKKKVPLSSSGLSINSRIEKETG